MKSNPALSYKEMRIKLDNILMQIEETVSFEEKKALYLEGIHLIKELENLLNKEQKIVVNVIKNK